MSIIAPLAAVFVIALFALGMVAFVRGEYRARLRDRDKQDRLRERREDELLNRLGHAYDKPWEEPPSEPDGPADEEFRELELAYDASHIEEEDLDLSPTGTF